MTSRPSSPPRAALVLLLAHVVAVGAACGRRGPSRPPAFDKVDTHTHFPPAAAPRVVALMDRYGIRTVVNLSGGFPGHGLEEQIAAAAQFPGRIVVFTELDWREPLRGPGWGERMAAGVTRAHELGARGVKITKGLGIGFKDYTGALIAVDDPELDAVFDRAGELGMPVAIHVGDPVAFWSPPTPDNERYAELRAHPGWSFYGKPVPSWEELHAALERRIARHPGTRIISVHFGNAPEYPERVAAELDRYPNLLVDTAARIPELGRHPPDAMRALMVAHADRILFGTDLGVGVHPEDLMLGSTGEEPPDDADVDHFFAASWQYFETDDRGFATPTPIQGAWTIDGVGLPHDALAAIYGGNARRLLGIAIPAAPAGSP